jgi:gliding motility-associated-like protein
LIKAVPIKNVITSFTFTTQYINNNSCPPLIVYLQSTSVNATSVKWSFGDGGSAGNNPTPSHTYNKPGVYKITLYGYDVNGLSDSSFDYVTVKGPFATLSSSILQSCTPAKVVLSAAAQNSVSYTWDFGDGTLQNSTDTFAVHTYTTPGVYNPALIMSDGGGCSATFELSDKIVMDTLHVAIRDNIQTICDSGWVQFTPDIVSVAVTDLQQDLQIHWDFGTGITKDTANVQRPGFYFPATGKYPVKITVQSLPGCTAEAVDTILVKASSRGIITGPSEVCEAILVSFTATQTQAGAVTWNWTFSNGNTSNLQNPSPQLFQASAEPYRIALVTALNGCLDTTVSFLTVHAKPPVNLGPRDTKMCLGDSIHLIATAGLTYLWSPAKYIREITRKDPYIVPDQSTAYGVQVTDGFGCINSDSAFIRVFMPFKMSVSKDTFACAGSSVQLRASGADSYQWITGVADLSNPLIANPIALPKTGTSYTVTGKDENSCFADTAVVMVNVEPLPVVNAGADIFVPVGSEVPLSPTGSGDINGWSWSPGTYLSCNTCQFPVSIPRSSVTYVVTGKNQYGCTAADTISINLQCVSNTTFVPSAFTPNNDGKNDLFYPMGKGVKSVKHFLIFNRSGEKIFEKNDFNLNDPSAGWDGNFKGYQMPLGTYVYMLELECDTGELFSMKGTVVLVR